MSLAALLLAACAGAPEPTLPPPPIVARLQCDRCHDAGDRFSAAPSDRSCVRCHQEILSGSRRFWATPARVAGWREHLHRLNASPDLSALRDRVTRRWFVAYLQSPDDLRPHLPAAMPRLPIGPEEASALADVLSLSDPDDPPPEGDPARGKALVTERCAPCHAVSGAGGSEPLAIDLAKVAERSAPSQVDRWLRDPSAVLPTARMPAPGLSDAERADVLAALFSGLPPPPLPHRPAAAPIPDRPVPFSEVDRAVFHEVCRHCHADPEPVGGDGGPGNTGGFGYAGAGLDLSSRDALLAHPGLLDPVDGPGSPPRLVAQLWARHDEVAGQPGPLLGMPLGLPPLPPERIALVEAWIAQGTPP